MTAIDDAGLFKLPYCCLDCAAKFCIGDAIATDTLHCPRCRSTNMHLFGLAPIVLDEYLGEIGTRN
jgi:DNA-directed RNA polymerase subunit RPC12/RpoP